MNCGCCSCEITTIKTCYICQKEINDDNVPRVQCVRCKIYMHTDCYDDAKDASLPYTKCNACNRIGSIGTDLKYINSLERK